MTQTQITIKSLKERTRQVGLELSDERLEALLPHMRRVKEAIAELEKLDLGDVGPANIFVPGRE